MNWLSRAVRQGDPRNSRYVIFFSLWDLPVISRWLILREEFSWKKSFNKARTIFSFNARRKGHHCYHSLPRLPHPQGRHRRNTSPSQPLSFAVGENLLHQYHPRERAKDDWLCMLHGERFLIWEFKGETVSHFLWKWTPVKWSIKAVMSSERVLSSLEFTLSGHFAEAFRPAFAQLKKKSVFYRRFRV